MRLSKIKIAGFKSFVEPINLALPGDLIGIVGPNGCGKSNIIDAMTWVMGESSAKQLRGDSMTDVIFAGANTRKPVGQASVELVFDNADGGIGGQYASYSEIAIKRQISRDGLSVYSLNGTHCRRRDITDIFLGTGLGPRSYSIIGQGTISRIIEAKPEELRGFLEEAAGISKYKERRRETENRIRHTRENLARLNDIQDEIEKQLRHLDRQARNAEKYKEFKETERAFSAQLLAFNWRSLSEELDTWGTQIREQETAVEAGIAEQRRIELEIEQHRERHSSETERFNETQSRYYAIGGEISRLEQSLQHAREQLEQLQSDRQQNDQDMQEVQDHLLADSEELNGLDERIRLSEPRLAAAREAETTTHEQLQSAEQAMHAWQEQWDAFNERSSALMQAAEVQKTRVEHIEQRQLSRVQRIERLREELGHLDASAGEQEVSELQQALSAAGQELGAQQQLVEDNDQRVHALRESIDTRSSELDGLRTELQSVRGRLASLEALQESALGKQQEIAMQWLDNRGLRDAARLAERLTVEPGWEAAIETVLGQNLQAVCSSNLADIAQSLQELTDGQLSFIDTDLDELPVRIDTDVVMLADKIDTSLPIEPLLAGVYAVDTLSAALSLRGQLASHESVVTPDGIWVGPGWLRVVRNADERSGVLARERDIREGQQRAAEIEREAAELGTELDALREELTAIEAEQRSAREILQTRQRQRSELHSRLTGQQTRLEHLRARTQQLETELAGLDQEHREDEEKLRETRQLLQQSLTDIEGLEDERNRHRSERDRLRDDLDAARREWQQARNLTQEIAVTQAADQTKRASLAQALERLRDHVGQLEVRRDEISAKLEEGSSPLQPLQDELDQALARRIDVEAELAEARNRVVEVDARLRDLDTERGNQEQNTQWLRTRLGDIRLDMQAATVRRETIIEQFADTGLDLETVVNELSDEVSVEALEAELEAIEKRINRLGPINLAAIDEFAQLSERKEYMDSQHTDLTEALEALEKAIRKFDRETRAMFKETYDKVNTSLQEMFPRLFGGGHAYMELTGDDLLDSGVAVMARPPGKRNSTIHLLSGGEKALTAIALVFSLFRLNPAPVCLLDEVDAPLDDANVGRFCDMVKEMSSSVQFMFITHNKITMELAEQLIGVTMHEAGVSRLVTVDVDEAVQLVAETETEA